MSGVLNRPDIRAYIGGTGSGKGVSVNEHLAAEKPARLLIWDPRAEYGKHAPAYSSMSALLGAFKHAKGGAVRARFVPGDGADLAVCFDFVCKLAFTSGNLTFLAEELSDVTQASHAPASWRRCITQGRHVGLRLIGCAQRPALIDKTFLGNCTYVRCFTLRYLEDRRAMAQALDVELSRVNALRTVSDEDDGKPVITTSIQWIEADFRRGVVADGARTLRRKRAAT